MGLKGEDCRFGETTTLSDCRAKYPRLVGAQLEGQRLTRARHLKRIRGLWERGVAYN